MKSSGKIGLGLVALFVSGQVYAQALDGYQVSWGAQGVPLSPWLNGLIVLMLALATYAFLRKRAGRGLMVLAGALIVGGLSMQADKNAWSLGPTMITTPAGSMTLHCDRTYYLETTVPGGVTLTVTPFFSAPFSAQGAAAPTDLGTECTTGTHLNPGSPGDMCYLCLID